MVVRSDKWVAWVGKLSPHFKIAWISLRIDSFIEITLVNSTLDFDLMSTMLRFWSRSVNSFLFPFDLTSMTLQDVSILTSLPLTSDDMLGLVEQDYSLTPTTIVSCTTHTSYVVAIRKWENVYGVSSTLEHVEFLWFCFINSSSFLIPGSLLCSIFHWP